MIRPAVERDLLAVRLAEGLLHREDPRDAHLRRADEGDETAEEGIAHDPKPPVALVGLADQRVVARRVANRAEVVVEREEVEQERFGVRRALPVEDALALADAEHLAVDDGAVPRVATASAVRGVRRAVLTGPEVGLAALEGRLQVEAAGEVGERHRTGSHRWRLRSAVAKACRFR